MQSTFAIYKCKLSSIMFSMLFKESTVDCWACSFSSFKIHFVEGLLKEMHSFAQDTAKHNTIWSEPKGHSVINENMAFKIPFLKK